MTLHHALALLLAGSLLGCGEDHATTPRAAPPDEPEAPVVAPAEPGGEGPEGEPPEDEEPDGDPTRAAPLDDQTAAALEAMGYVSTTPTQNPEQRGVTRHESGAWPGVNLYSTRHRASAVLVDMDGSVLHEWAAPRGDDEPSRWMHVEPLDGGDLLVVAMAHSLTRHAWDSSIVWRVPMPAHHDVAVADDGQIYALVRWADRYTYRGVELPVLVDGVVRVSPGGERGPRIPLLPAMEDHLDRRRLERIRARVEAGETAGLMRGGSLGDLLHTNSIEPLRQAIEGVAPAGSWLLSFRNIDRVAILDRDFTRALWVWGEGELSMQHDATPLDDGRILIFDNGTRRRRSRVIEVDPRTNTVEWSYTDEGLFTELRGGAQRLPNGNTLITESDRGHALEVTRSGEVVWEFFNPDVRRTSNGDERGVIYRLNRFAPSRFPRLRAQGQTAATPGRDDG